jgi:hypothetical protein
VHEPVDVSSLLGLRQLQASGERDVVARIVSLFLDESEEGPETLEKASTC